MRRMFELGEEHPVVQRHIHIEAALAQARLSAGDQGKQQGTGGPLVQIFKQLLGDAALLGRLG